MNEKRNWKIYFDWIEGKEYDQLSKEFNLSTNTIKQICTDLVPPSIKNQSWQRANSYKRFREWKRKQLQNKQASM